MAGGVLDIARAMNNVGAGLLALPLAELPDIAAVQLMTARSQPLEIRMQLSAVHDDDQVTALLGWAEALPDAAATGTEHDEYIRLAVAGTIGGVRVEVWTHMKGEHLVDTGCFLSLPTDGRPHRLPLGVLRALAVHRGVSGHA